MLVGLLCFASSAAAGSKATLYWMKDDTTGPVGDGLLIAYDPAHPNVPNGTQPHTRFVFPATDAVAPVRFMTPADEKHPDRIVGPLLVGLWLGASAVYKGNLTAALVEVTASGSHPLAKASVLLDADLNKTPNPTSLIPPPPNPVPPTPDPNNPQAVNETIAYEQGQAVGVAFYEAAQALPLLLKPPVVFYMGIVDFPFNATSRFAIVYTLTQGSSPLPIPIAGFSQLEYDYLLGPSYVYVPWYSADPPKPSATTTHSMTPTHPSSASMTPSGGVTYTSSSKGSPAAPLFTIVATVAAVALALRRRL